MNKDSETVRKLALNADLLAAIAETGNFSRAAERLGIVQPAVSQRIKVLEELLQVPLFHRTTRKLTLTPVGEIVCAEAIESAKRWVDVVERVREARHPRAIRISLPSSLAMKWMIPALPQVKELGLDVVLEADDSIVDLNRGSVHVAIRYGEGPYPGFHSERLTGANLVPVAGIAAGNGALTADEIRSRRNLLIVDQSGEVDGTQYSWGTYFSEMNWPDLTVETDLRFSRADLAIQAAICGMGVALGRTLLIENDLNNNFLVAVGKPVPARSSYWLVTTASFAATQSYKLLCKFLKQEMQRTKSIIE
jgi:LysR family transcriptional regulator, glycine cleavage system transcriptional activator